MSLYVISVRVDGRDEPVAVMPTLDTATHAQRVISDQLNKWLWSPVSRTEHPVGFEVRITATRNLGSLPSHDVS